MKNRLFAIFIALPFALSGQTATSLTIETDAIGASFRQAEQPISAYRLEATYMAALRDTSRSPCGGNGNDVKNTKSRPSTKILQSEVPHFELKTLQDGVYSIQVFYGQKTGEQTGTYHALPPKTVTLDGKESQFYFIPIPKEQQSQKVGNLHLFPNPGNEQCTISLPSSNLFEIKLIDVQGKILQKQTNSSERVVWNLSHLLSGVYTVLATDQVTGLQYQGKWIKVD